MIEFNGKEYRTTKEGNVFVVFLGVSEIEPKDFLGKQIRADSEEYIVFETLDPYKPPFVEAGHKNAGKFAELTVVKKGEEVPRTRHRNSSSSARGKLVDGEVVRG